jgi:hypothetical protein
MRADISGTSISVGVIRTAGVVLLAVSALSCAAICHMPLTRGGARPEPIPADAGSARFRAMVFEVKMPENRIAPFDAQRIGVGSKTAEDFEKALKRFGEVKVLYQVDQAVSLKEAAKIVISDKIPVVTARRVAAGGQMVDSVQYQNVGVIFQIAEPTKDVAAGRGHQLDVELAVATDSPVEITPRFAPKNFRNVQMSCGALTEFRKPYVAAGIDSAAREKDQMSAAYVCRVVLDPRE